MIAQELTQSAAIQLSGKPRKIEFLLAKSAENHWYWSVFMPTQMNGAKTRDLAEENLAKTIARLKKGDFLINERDFLTGKNIDYLGGTGHLLEKYNLDEDVPRKDNPKPRKRVQKKSKRKGKAKPARTPKRNRSKKRRILRKVPKRNLPRGKSKRVIRPKRRKLHVRPRNKKGK